MSPQGTPSSGNNRASTRLHPCTSVKNTGDKARKKFIRRWRKIRRTKNKKEYKKFQIEQRKKFKAQQQMDSITFLLNRLHTTGQLQTPFSSICKRHNRLRHYTALRRKCHRQFEALSVEDDGNTKVRRKSHR